MHQTSHALQRVCISILMGALASCATQQMPQQMVAPKLRSGPFYETALSCGQANRVSYRVVEQLGYRVTTLTPASDGRAGLIAGDRASYQQRRSQRQSQATVTVKITCEANGVRIDARAGGAGNSGFPAVFFVRFKGRVEAFERGEPPKPPDQIQVVMHPLVGLEAKLEFGTEVTQVLPVRLEIANTTDHTYALETDQIVLLTSSGERVKPLSKSNGVFPTPALTSQALAPGTSLKAYLYYPLNSYTGARGFIIEKDSQERAGFAMEF